MIVLDASVLIGHLDGRDPHHEAATELLGSHIHELLGASWISLAETFVAPARADRLEQAREALERLAIQELQPGRGAAVRLAELRAETGLKLPDCCVLLAAREHGAGVASFDRDLCRHAADLHIPVVD